MVRAHASGFDKGLGGVVNVTAFATTRRVHVERATINFLLPLGGRRNFVAHRLLVVGDLELGVVHAVELPQHPDKIRLTPQQSSRRQTGRPVAGSTRLIWLRSPRRTGASR